VRALKQLLEIQEKKYKLTDKTFKEYVYHSYIRLYTHTERLKHMHEIWCQSQFVFKTCGTHFHGEFCT